MALKTASLVSRNLIKTPIAPRLRAIVRNADHRCRHDGLARIVKDYTGIHVDTLEQGEFVLLINSGGNIITLYGPNRVIVQQRSEQKFHDERAFRFLPQIFLQKKTLSYDQALRKFLHEVYPKWAREEG